MTLPVHQHYLLDKDHRKQLLASFAHSQRWSRLLSTNTQINLCNLRRAVKPVWKSFSRPFNSNSKSPCKGLSRSADENCLGSVSGRGSNSIRQLVDITKQSRLQQWSALTSSADKPATSFHAEVSIFPLRIGSNSLHATPYVFLRAQQSGRYRSQEKVKNFSAPFVNKQWVTSSDMINLHERLP